MTSSPKDLPKEDPESEGETTSTINSLQSAGHHSKSGEFTNQNENKDKNTTENTTQSKKRRKHHHHSTQNNTENSLHTNNTKTSDYFGNEYSSTGSAYSTQCSMADAKNMPDVFISSTLSEKKNKSQLEAQPPAEGVQNATNDPQNEKENGEDSNLIQGNNEPNDAKSHRSHTQENKTLGSDKSYHSLSSQEPKTHESKKSRHSSRRSVRSRSINEENRSHHSKSVQGDTKSVHSIDNNESGSLHSNILTGDDQSLHSIELDKENNSPHNKSTHDFDSSLHSIPIPDQKRSVTQRSLGEPENSPTTPKSVKSSDGWSILSRNNLESEVGVEDEVAQRLILDYKILIRQRDDQLIRNQRMIKELHDQLAMTNEMQAIQAKIDLHVREHKNDAEKVQELKEAKESLAKLNEDRRQKYDNLIKQIKELRKNIDAKKAEIEDKNSSIKTLEEGVAILKPMENEINKVKQQNAEIANQIELLTKKTDDLQQKKDIILTDCRQKSEEISVLEKEEANRLFAVEQLGHVRDKIGIALLMYRKLQRENEAISLKIALDNSRSDQKSKTTIGDASKHIDKLDNLKQKYSQTIDEQLEERNRLKKELKRIEYDLQKQKKPFKNLTECRKPIQSPKREKPPAPTPLYKPQPRPRGTPSIRSSFRSSNTPVSSLNIFT